MNKLEVLDYHEWPLQETGENANPTPQLVLGSDEEIKDTDVPDYTNYLARKLEEKKQLTETIHHYCEGSTGVIEIYGTDPKSPGRGILKRRIFIDSLLPSPVGLYVTEHQYGDVKPSNFLRELSTELAG